MNCQQALKVIQDDTEGLVGDELFAEAWQHAESCPKRKCPAKSLLKKLQAQIMTCGEALRILNGEIPVVYPIELDIAFAHATGSCPDFSNCLAREYALDSLAKALELTNL